MFAVVTTLLTDKGAVFGADAVARAAFAGSSQSSQSQSSQSDGFGWASLEKVI